jgi:serine/threonine protein kinase
LALTPGTRLGVYEITALIGVGGMGEVYKATDTNLKRAVAIKVPPALVALIPNDSRVFSVKRKCSPR